jgi:hypothetical protein
VAGFKTKRASSRWAPVGEEIELDIEAFIAGCWAAALMAIAASKQKTIANLLVIVLTSLNCEVVYKKTKRPGPL